jgi:hypothetical protein
MRLSFLLFLGSTDGLLMVRGAISEVGGWAMLRIMLRQKNTSYYEENILLMLFLAMHTNIYDMKLSTVR